MASSISPAQTHPRPAVPSPQRRPVCAGRDSGPGRTGRGAADGLSSKQGCRDAALSGVSPLGSRRLGDRLAPARARAQQAQRGRSAGRFARRAAVGAPVSPWRSGGPKAPGPAAWDERNWRVKRRERRGKRLPKRALQRKVRAPVPSQPVPPSPDSLPPVFSPIAATSPLWPFRERRTRNPSVDSASETSTPAGLPNLLLPLAPLYLSNVARCFLSLQLYQFSGVILCCSRIVLVCDSIIPHLFSDPPATMATSIIPVANETLSSSSRMTKEGKKITYQMSVIQQPERARACGSGAKSSADRRPVDPPPIVELRIFEGENRQNDITFSYNANFFLFATLENARSIAQGRVQPNPASFPVLTGTPVAGMAYLDRPNPAGYFIFPDLSVRHEGKYRLSFALYEELKEHKDMDSDDRGENVQNGRVDAHVSHRLEVKSAPFNVYSAKKFPGLTESTALSRMVAEQGCRVRIRRDVRMRRRDNKAKEDWDEYEEKTAYERNRTATPDVYGQNAVHTPQPMTDGSDRPRSQSNASNASFAPPPRRPSMQDMANSYQQGYQNQMPPPQAPQNAYSSQMQYPAAPAPQYQSQYPPAPQQPAMHPPQAPYMQSQHSWQPQPQPQMPMAQPYGYSSNQQYGHYEQPAPVRHDSLDYSSAGSEYRRPSLAGPQQTPNQMGGPFGTLDSGYNRHQSQMNPPPAQPMPSSQAPHPNGSQAPASSHSMNGYSLAPLKTLQPPTDKLEPVSPSYPMSAGIPMSGPVGAPNEPLASRGYASKPYSSHSDSSSQSLAGSTKRSFSATFDTNHIEQPLRGGARPNVNLPVDDNGLSALDASTDEEILDERAMSYRRADGTHRSRRVPLSN